MVDVRILALKDTVPLVLFQKCVKLRAGTVCPVSGKDFQLKTITGLDDRRCIQLISVRVRGSMIRIIDVVGKQWGNVLPFSQGILIVLTFILSGILISTQRLVLCLFGPEQDTADLILLFKVFLKGDLLLYWLTLIWRLV